MPIGTSDGEHFDDEFHQAVSKYLPKDQSQVSGVQPTPAEKVNNAFNDIEIPQLVNPVDPKAVWGGRQKELQPTEEGSQLSQRPFPGPGMDFLKRTEKGIEEQGSKNTTEGEWDMSGGDRNLQKVLADPRIQEAINNPKIDRSHDVPYEAGASNKPDDLTTHIDKRIPTSVDIDGKTFDPAIPANIHEQVEREVMERLIHLGMRDEKAYEIAHHEYAEPAEDMWYKQQGINIDKVNEWWSKQDKITEHENPANPPPDLYTKPYPHNKVEGVAHEPTGVYAEWPTNTQLAMNILTPGSERSSSDKPMEKLMTGFPARSATPGPINPKTAPDVPGTINPSQLGKVIKSPKVTVTPAMQDEMLRQGLTSVAPKDVYKLSPKDKKALAAQQESARGDIEQFKRENRMIAEPSQIQQTTAKDLMTKYKGNPREEDILSQKLEQLRIRSANYGEGLLGRDARDQMKLIRSRLKEIPEEQDAKKLNEFSKSMLKKE